MDVEMPDFNDILRDGVLEIIGSIDIEGIPVGGILSKIIGLLWPAPDPSRANWEGIKKYAEAMVKDEIDKERLEVLNSRLKGFASISYAYKNTSMGSPQKGQHLTVLLDDLRLFHDDFWNKKSPEQMFPLYCTYGTLWIGALFDQAFRYKEVYLKDDPDEQAHLSEFRDNVAKYVAGAQAIYDRVYARRFAKLEMTEWQSQSLKLIGMEYTSTWTFTDKFDKYTRTSRESSLNDASFHGPAAQAQMERELRDKVFNINSDYVKNLQDTLAVAQLWQYLEPMGIRPLTHIVIDDQGPWGGDKNIAQDFADRPPPESRVTKVALSTGAFIDGLELSYSDKPGGWHGGGGGKREELVLDADEFIVEVSGESSSLIEHISFKTNKNRILQGGTSHGTPFSATGRPNWKQVSLHAISGWTDGNRLTGLKLHWKHLADFAPFIPSYKKTDPLPLAVNLYLKAENGKFISTLSEEYSGAAASNEYFPKLGDTAIALKITLPSNAKTLADRDMVQIETTETSAGNYKILSKFSNTETYYYLPNYGRKQLWSVIKMIPSDGPILIGDMIYLRNMDGCNYLSINDSGYIISVAEPHAWEVILP